MEDILMLLSRHFYYKPLDLRKIIESFKNIKDIMEAPKDAFLKIGISGKSLDEFIKNRNTSSANYNANTTNIKIITILDTAYPAVLKNICDAPPILFYKGSLDCLNNKCLAVVGSRKASDYGKRATEFFARELAPHFTIISGLAYGIDSLAHEMALSNNGRAAAILGSGLDDKNIYPKANLLLAKKIVESGGLLISEVPPGIGPQKFHFPMRNRIIAGLARGILIIEAGEKSGTLITAKLGLENGVDIFAVPNNIFHPNAAGVNFLIKYGAHIATSAEDILSFYGIEIKAAKEEYAPKNSAEKIILDNLITGEKHINELHLLTGMAIADLIGTLTDLEMAGVIKNISGKYVRI